MYKPVLTIFYQFNPWQSSIGGIQTVIRSFLKYCPTDFDLRLVGTQNDSSHRLGEWQERELFGKPIRFMPVLTIKDDNIRQLIPTTIKYTADMLERWEQSISLSGLYSISAKAKAGENYSEEKHWCPPRDPPSN